MTILSVNDSDEPSIDQLLKMSDWLHCNTCFSQPGDGSSFFLTDCAHIYCDRCQDKGWKQKCLLCGTPNPPTRKLTSKLTPPIDMYFSEPAKIMKQIFSQMKQLIETTEFQHRQRKRYIDNLRNKIRNQKAIVEQHEKELRAQVQSQFDVLQRENLKLKEENAYLKRLLSEKSYSGMFRSPSGKPSSSPAFVSSSSPKHLHNRNASTSLIRKMSPSYGLTTITANRISVRTPPADGRMGVIPPATPAQRSVVQEYPKSVPHPIGLNSKMECSPGY